MSAVHLEEFTEQEIRKAVSVDLNLTNFQLLNYKIRPASDNPLGFLGDHVRITVTVLVNSEEKTRHYFGKKIPTKIFSHYDYAQKTGAFYKEIELYKTLFFDFQKAIDPKRVTQKWMPNFYFSRGADMLIVEDLSVDGYYMLPERSLMDLEHVYASVDAMAVMHAASYIFEEKLNEGKVRTRSSKYTPGTKTTIGELYPNLIFETEASDIKGHPGNTFWEAGFRSQLPVIDLLPDYTPEQKQNIKENLSDKLRSCLQFVKPSNTFRNVLLHGDLWANNLMFRKEETGEISSMIVDFQLARYGPPAHDMMMFLHLVQTREFRKTYEPQILDRYYQKLKEELAAEGLEIENLLSKKEWAESIVYYREYAILNSIMYFQLILTPSNISGQFLSSSELFDLNMHSDRSEMILACYKQDEVCRSRMTESVREAAEMYKWV